MVETVGANTSGIGVVTLPAPTLQQLQEAHGITSITVGDLQGRQVLVVTDPTQLEALQVILLHRHTHTRICTFIYTHTQTHTQIFRHTQV